VLKVLGEDARSRDDLEAAIENYQLFAESERSGLETLRILAELLRNTAMCFPALFTVEKRCFTTPRILIFWKRRIVHIRFPSCARIG